MSSSKSRYRAPKTSTPTRRRLSWTSGTPTARVAKVADGARVARTNESTPDNRGCGPVASDGDEFAFAAPFRGFMGATHLNRPVDGLVAYGNGYLMIAQDGGVSGSSEEPPLGGPRRHTNRKGGSGKPTTSA
jgi:hypothetical protein